MGIRGLFGTATVGSVALQSGVQSAQSTDVMSTHVSNFGAAETVYESILGEKMTLARPGAQLVSTVPASTSVSTAGYTRPDNCDDTAATGAQTRWMHGLMVNPWQGVTPPSGAQMGFDSYYGTGQSAPSLSYDHDLNVDPGRSGSPVDLDTPKSLVKCESFPDEGGHTSSALDKTRMLKMSVLTVVPSAPPVNCFRPPIRGTDKTVKSIWTWDNAKANLSALRSGKIITGFRPLTTGEIASAATRMQHPQQTFAPLQEQARRWNPGPRQWGWDIYGNGWYNGWSPLFQTFFGDYTDAELEEMWKGACQCGIDLYGLLADNGYYYSWQAHHAGRKGIALFAALAFNDQDMLDQCTFSLHPEHFGVDDAYCGYVGGEIYPEVEEQYRFYKGAYPYRWEQAHFDGGIPEWTSIWPYAQNGNDEQVTDPDIARRSYQVLSFDNGAMYQCLWGMLADPTATYYNPAYFDFADRYLAIRFGDQIDGVWDASSDNTGTNGHFTGNWWSINPTTATVQNFKTMRDACTRPNYVSQLIPEALPRPQVTHDGSSGHLDVNFNINDFRCPQNKDAAITGYDLRWTCYAGNALSAADANEPDLIENMDWKQIDDITLPYQLTGVPRGERIKVQIRMKNVNGPGPWMDDRFAENYNGSAVFDPLSTGFLQRYSTNIDVPDLAAFNQPPINFRVPSFTPSKFLPSGQLLSGAEGTWEAHNPVTGTSYKWQESANGLTGWSDIPDADAIDYTTQVSDEGRFVRSAIRKTNSDGTSAWAYSDPVSVTAPVLTPLFTGDIPGDDRTIPIGSALGGKRLLVSFVTRTDATPVHGFTVDGIASNPVHEAASGDEWRSLHYLEVPGGVTATDIVMNAAASARNQASVFESPVSIDTTPVSVDTIQTSTGNNTYRWENVGTVLGGAVVSLHRSTEASQTIVLSGDLTNLQSGVTGGAFAYAPVTDGSSFSLEAAYGQNFNIVGDVIVLQPA